MTIHRFYIPDISSQLLVDSSQIVFPSEISHQIKKVLHLKDGEQVIVFDGSGKEWIIELVNNETMQQLNSNKTVLGRIIKEVINQSEPKIFVNLYQALIPRDKFEEVLQKGTEVGVSCFVPTQTARSIVHAKDVDDKKISRWQKITQEATEQSERGVVPQVLPALKFELAIEQALKEGKVLIAWEEESLESRIKNQELWNEKKISLFIGPEGGFTQEEIAFAKERGAITISLGPRILRSETAGPVAVFSLLSY